MILLTGGLGFIGSHTAVELLNNNKQIIIIDNLSNSKLDVLDKIIKITNKPENIIFHKADILNKEEYEFLFQQYNIEYIIHFASLKAVNESITKPLLYYKTNINLLLNILKLMDKYNSKRIIFSSSSTVYGTINNPPFTENAVVGVGLTCPYAQTKYFQEQILQDYAKINNKIDIIILRYFNPVGAHNSGLIGESPNDIPNNLFPYLLKVSKGEIKELSIFGNDYDTNDGYCVRDFIHVMDLANAHSVALDYDIEDNNLDIFNIGTGKGTSVIELVNEFKKINNVKLPYKIVSRREGDIPVSLCDVNKAKNVLNWTAKYDIINVCRDGYLFSLNG